MNLKVTFAHISIGSTIEYFFLFRKLKKKYLRRSEYYEKTMTGCTLYLQFGKRPQKAEQAKYCRHLSDLSQNDFLKTMKLGYKNIQYLKLYEVKSSSSIF